MARTYAETLREFLASPMADCVRPAEPYQSESARTIRQWEALESLGYVRLRAEYDEHATPDDIECSCGDPDCIQSPEYMAKNGMPDVFGSIGEYLKPEHVADMQEAAPQYPYMVDSDWESADSVWGHVGYRNVLDWRENMYVIGIMRETIDGFRHAWKEHVHAKGAAR